MVATDKSYAVLSMTKQSRRFVRSLSPYAFKSGEWGEIVGTCEVDGRTCYELLFADGSVDTWVMADEHGNYEFELRMEAS